MLLLVAGPARYDTKAGVKRWSVWSDGHLGAVIKETWWPKRTKRMLWNLSSSSKLPGVCNGVVS